MSVVEVLNRAADLIEQHGWIQHNSGWWRGTETPLCVEGAIAAAAGLPTVAVTGSGHVQAQLVQRCPAGEAVRDYLNLGPLVECETKPNEITWSNFLWQWNDLETCTAESVVAVLRAAALVEAARTETVAA